MLDALNIPSGKKTKKGTIKPLTLAERIEQFQAVEPEHAQTLDALRYVGNLGAHGASVSREAVLDALEIYEDCMRELFGKHKDKMKALTAKILDAKGDYKAKKKQKHGGGGQV